MATALVTFGCFVRVQGFSCHKLNSSNGMQISICYCGVYGALCF